MESGSLAVEVWGHQHGGFTTEVIQDEEKKPRTFVERWESREERKGMEGVGPSWRGVGEEEEGVGHSRRGVGEEEQGMGPSWRGVREEEQGVGPS